MGIITAVVVDYRTEEATRRVVKELHERDVDTVVVDNGRSEQLKQWAEETPHVELVRPSENRGYAGGNNAGIASIRDQSDYVLVVNPDVQFPQQFDMGNFIAPMKQREDLKLLAPTVTDETGKELHNVRPLLIEMFARLNLVPKVRASESGSEVSAAYSAPGSCLLVDPVLYEDGRLFNEQFFLYREEVELCIRCLQSGHSIGIHTQERVIHDEPDGLRHSKKYQMYYNIRNWFLLTRLRFSRYRRPIATIIIGISIVSQLVKIIKAGNSQLVYPLLLGVYDGALGRFGCRRYLDDERSEDRNE